MKKVAIALAGAALLGVLVACAPQTGAGITTNPFAGTWTLQRIISDNEELAVSEEDVRQFIAQGLPYELVLNDDGTSTLNVAGTLAEGTWEATGDATAALTTADGEVVEIAVSGNVLTYDEGDETLVFSAVAEDAPAGAEPAQDAPAPAEDEIGELTVEVPEAE